MGRVGFGRLHPGISLVIGLTYQFLVGQVGPTDLVSWRICEKTFSNGPFKYGLYTINSLNHSHI